jgi:hypothetical protein
MSKPASPVCKTPNRPACNEVLKRRGSLTVCLDPEMKWEASLTCKRGRQPEFSNAAIRTCLLLKVPFGMALGQTTGVVQSFLRLVGLDLPVSDCSTVSRLKETLQVGSSCISTSIGEIRFNRGCLARRPIRSLSP